MLLPIQQRRVVLPNGRVESVSVGAAPSSAMSGLNGSSRKTCLDCTRKHLSQAAVLMEEALQGYPDHRWLAVGHLAEASAESLDQYPDLAKEIRAHRVAYMNDPAYKVPVVALIGKASALAGQSGTGVAGLGASSKGSGGAGETGPGRVRRTPQAPGKLFSPMHDGEKPYGGMSWGPPIKYVKIPGGEWGTVATLKVMKELVLGKWGHRNPEVVLLAKKIVADVSPGPTKDYEAMAGALLGFMKTRVKYELDSAGLEWVQTPHYTLLVSGSGDCFAKGTNVTRSLAGGRSEEVQIENLRVGDRIYSRVNAHARGGPDYDEFCWTTVLNVWDRGVRPTWQVRTDNRTKGQSRFVRLTPNHKVLVAQSDGKLVEARVSDLDPGVALPRIDRDEFVPMDPEDGRTARVLEVVRDDLPVQCYDVQTENGCVWLPDADCHVRNCDDHSTATAALAMALGFRAGFRTVKGDRGRPEQWSHVYPVIGIPAGKEDVWLTADSTQKESVLGWDPPEGKLFGMKTWVIDPQTAEGLEWDT